MRQAFVWWANLYCSAAHTGVWRERLWWWLHPLRVAQQYHLASLVAGFSSTGISQHNLLPHIPLIPLSTVNSSPHLGLLHNPQTPAPSHCTLQGTCIPVQGMYGYGKDCLILIPFRLPQISSFSLKCFSSNSVTPMWGSDPCFSSPTRQGTSSPTNTPVFPPSSFIPPSFTWFYILFSTGQVLLSALSWCSAGTPVSEGVFLIYLWREMYSTSTYSSTILFSPVPQLPYPFICWWTSRLLPCPSYCKQCCDEHWGARVSFNSGFLSVYAQQWDCWVIWQFYFQFFKESPHCSP